MNKKYAMKVVLAVAAAGCWFELLHIFVCAWPYRNMNDLELLFVPVTLSPAQVLVPVVVVGVMTGAAVIDCTFRKFLPIAAAWCVMGFFSITSLPHAIIFPTMESPFNAFLVLTVVGWLTQFTTESVGAIAENHSRV